MFNDLKDEAKQRFFGTRKILSTLTVDGMVTMTFENGTEVVTQSEFDAGVSDHAIEAPAERQKHFVDRTTSLRVAVGKLLKEHNPRYWEFHKLIQWIGEVISGGYTEAVGRLFGVKDFEGEVTFDKLCEFLDEKKIEYSTDLSEVEKVLLEVLCSKKVTLHNVLKNQLLMTFQNKMEGIVDKAVNGAFGISDEVLRMEDIDSVLQKKGLEIKSHAQDQKAGEVQPTVEAHVDGHVGEEPSTVTSENTGIAQEESGAISDENPAK